MSHQSHAELDEAIFYRHSDVYRWKQKREREKRRRIRVLMVMATTMMMMVKKNLINHRIWLTYAFFLRLSFLIILSSALLRKSFSHHLFFCVWWWNVPLAFLRLSSFFVDMYVSVYINCDWRWRNGGFSTGAITVGNIVVNEMRRIL